MPHSQRLNVAFLGNLSCGIPAALLAARRGSKLGLISLLGSLLGWMLVLTLWNDRKARLSARICHRKPMSESSLREIYVGTDIETDGPVAGKHFLLSIGSAAYLADKALLGTFSANLETLPGSAPDPKTAAWWATQPEAWSACRQNLEPPAVALKR